ncbi:SACOL1771 family peroxiredoxin [Staphylococcus hyicus]|uniref:SACOL1771 family peroxiredoxin n=1 Tax=Staphylococcus hyicus TaxID=1284 RepID=UPI00217CC8F6|nr:SACOL1771 family peroxiredoxin [Staphylococcus hyicus]UWF57762.1 SACOL1771 family peroxiredoxin [Staphylococcus hyicus]
MTQHAFKINFEWQGGRNSVGKLQGDVIHEQFSIPNSLGGTGIGTNPDELLVSAAGSCFTISLAATLERAHIKVKKLNVSTIGTASLSHQIFTMEEITHHVNIYVQDFESKQKLHQRLERLLHIADRNCMVSNSLRGNVPIKINPLIYI